MNLEGRRLRVAVSWSLEEEGGGQVLGLSHTTFKASSTPLSPTHSPHLDPLTWGMSSTFSPSFSPLGVWPRWPPAPFGRPEALSSTRDC